MTNRLLLAACLAAGVASAQETPLTPADCAMRVHPPEHVAMMRNIPIDEAKKFIERAEKECPKDEQAPRHDMAGMDMPGMDMSGMHHHGGGTLGAYAMMRDASGTSWQPEAAGMGGLHGAVGKFSTMEHGFLNLGFDGQGGPSGKGEAFTTSMGMVSAQRPLGGGALTLRAMGSVDPLIAPKGYPMLFQNDEGKVDTQHAHDLFMELSATYNHPIGENKSAFVYAGLPGEPALGPAVFMHRASGEDMPQAPLTHHNLDSTHITYGVVTGGVVLGPVKLDASAFNGREPDDQRMNIEPPRFDSRSARVTYNPTEHWSFQASAGHLASPEASEPIVAVDRITASASYVAELAGKTVAATAAWGRNVHLPGPTLDGYLGEATVKLSKAAEVFGRYERVEKDNLTPAGPATVNAWTAGAARDIAKTGPVRYGVGVDVTITQAPPGLESQYGAHPVSALAWLRAKLGN